MAETQRDLWIFAYGSLMWRPDFAYTEVHRAELTGYRRALCIHSMHYRGTPECPGLVFGLDQGGSCSGVAFLIQPDEAAHTLHAVRQRELITSVYTETEAAVRLADGRTVTAVTYVADRAHSQYAGALAFAHIVAIVLRAQGTAGRNLDYVRNTHAHLVELGIDDGELARLWSALDQVAHPAG